ncbi:MAG: hypothetical protein JWO49_2100 [Arthrobacter sp.]|nr:hypothetical protein [Arthrobacter sp.]
MSSRFKTGAAAIAVAALMFGSAPVAVAEGTTSTPDGQQTLQEFSAPRAAAGAPAFAPAKSRQMSAPEASIMAVGSRRARLYSGNWALYSEENVDFYFDWTKVRSSSGFQRVGAFGFNTVQALGIVRTYRTDWQHTWRALTDAGIGTPTPWGNVNIYHTTLVQRANVYGDGAWYAWQG